MQNPKTIAQAFAQADKELRTQQQSLPALQQKTMLVSRYGSREQFLEVFNPSYQMQIVLDERDCFFGKYPTLTDLKLGYGANAPVMWLIPQLYNLSEYCGVKEKLQGMPLEESAFVLATNFHYLKISEFMLFFYRFKSGRYGRFYGNVDPLIIATSLREFCKERAWEIDRFEQEQREREREESRKRAVTWEQYCEKKGLELKDNPNPLSRPMPELINVNELLKPKKKKPQPPQ